MKELGELVGIAKFTELINAKKHEESKKILWVLAVIGAIAAVAAIAFAVYK